jgi:hypothetical protein
MIEKTTTQCVAITITSRAFPDDEKRPLWGSRHAEQHAAR